MRGITAAARGIAASVVLVLAGAGCSAPGPGPATHSGPVYTLTTTSGGPLVVHLVKVVDPFSGAAHPAPAPGTRLVEAVFVVLDAQPPRSSSAKDLDVDVGADTEVVGRNTEDYRAARAISLEPTCAAFPARLVLVPGNPVSGCVAFEVPDAEPVSSVLFRLPGVASDDEAEWLLHS